MRFTPHLLAILVLAASASAQSLDHVRIEGVPDAPQLAVELEQAGYTVVEGSVSENTIELHAVPAETAALQALGYEPVLISIGRPWGNGTSYRCVAPPTRRGGIQSGGGTNDACDGVFAQDLNALWTAEPQTAPGAGALVQLQLRYRDPFNTSNQTTSFSNALELGVCP